MAMKGYFAFLKAPILLEPHQTDLVSYPGLLMEEYYASAEMLSVYSMAPADWAMEFINVDSKQLQLYNKVVVFFKPL